MVLAVTPARGGSKGIPRKNVRLMNGKPLIYYAIHNAKNCPSIDDVVVSSDDEEILKIASSDDTYISVVNKPHLFWTKKDDCYVPNYEKRLNRQQLPPNYLETGAFLITRRECMEINSRIGKKVSVYEMPKRIHKDYPEIKFHFALGVGYDQKANQIEIDEAHLCTDEQWFLKSWTWNQCGR